VPRRPERCCVGKPVPERGTLGSNRTDLVGASRSEAAVACQSEGWFCGMGKAVDTGIPADPPSPGAAALMQALAGFGDAAEASSTTADQINGHAREQTASPSKTVAQVLGEIAWLMTQSPRHKAVRLSDLEWLMPAILLRQLRIFYSGEQPVGACSLGA
jgi:hypothetical protein